MPAVTPPPVILFRSTTTRVSTGETALAADKSLRVPTLIAGQIPKEAAVRVIVLIPDGEPEEDWNQLTSAQFLSGYADTDSVYDAL
jgi:hypothetical protein